MCKVWKCDGLFFFLLFLASSRAGRSADFPPGWNGLARTPPMGWRSWNAFGNRITQPMMVDAAEAMAAKNRTVAGWPPNVSLCDLGYCSVGVDEGWEGCGQGVNGTQHDAHGTPTIAATFPSLGAMVEKIHDLNLSAGWYLNGCKCGERVEKTINYQGDVHSLHDFGFDAVKIDGCGRQRNQTEYAALMAKTGRGYGIENCHWGDCTDSDDSSCPTREWCPFNWYRTSGDINDGAESWLGNLQTTIKFQDYSAPLSQPHCWAYPDMLEVGRVKEPAPGTAATWNRAHFGAWCIVSAPLILGMALTDAELDPVLDVIGNKEAIAVNQNWDGHPGMLVQNLVGPYTPYAPAGATVPSSAAGDFQLSGGASVGAGRPDVNTSGSANIRTGGPNGVAMIKIGSGVIGKGHVIKEVSLAFRYTAGYTGGKLAPTVRVLLLDALNSSVVSVLAHTSPLGEYSWDHFIGYSPPILITAAGLSVPNDTPLVVALEVTNHDRNLQIPVDDLAGGFNLSVTWGAVASRDANLNDNLANVFGLGQLWAKRQPGGAAAVLIINHSPTSLHHALNLSQLNLTAASYHVRDIWARASVGTAAGSLPVTVAPYDSAFLLLSPGAVAPVAVLAD